MFKDTRCLNAGFDDDPDVATLSLNIRTSLFVQHKARAVTSTIFQCERAEMVCAHVFLRRLLRVDAVADNLVRRSPSDHGLLRKHSTTTRTSAWLSCVVYCDAFRPAFHQAALAALVVLVQLCPTPRAVDVDCSSRKLLSR